MLKRTMININRGTRLWSYVFKHYAMIIMQDKYFLLSKSRENSCHFVYMLQNNLLSESHVYQVFFFLECFKYFDVTMFYWIFFRPWPMLCVIASVERRFCRRQRPWSVQIWRRTFGQSCRRRCTRNQGKRSHHLT